MTKVVVALGNPGKEYADTRHNIGFQFFYAFSHQEKCPLLKKWKSIAFSWVDKNVDIWFLAPQTFMNESGQALKKFLKDFSVAPEDILVVQDELDLPVGTFRFKKGGSEGGHNGLLSVTRALGSREYGRLRIGIGPRPSGDLSDFVLKSFSNEEKDAIFPLFPHLFEGVKTWISYGSDVAMNQFNGKVSD